MFGRCGSEICIDSEHHSQNSQDTAQHRVGEGNSARPVDCGRIRGITGPQPGNVPHLVSLVHPSPERRCNWLMELRITTVHQSVLSQHGSSLLFVDADQARVTGAFPSATLVF